MKKTVIRVINKGLCDDNQDLKDFDVPLDYRPAGGSQWQKIIAYVEDNNLEVGVNSNFGLIDIEEDV